MTASARASAYVEALRPRQWIKSTFVFAPLVFSNSFRLPGAVVSAVVTAASFCLCASAVYLINDICDVERDRLHPTKCRRPIARGALAPRAAAALSVAVLVPGFGLPALLDLRLLLIAAAYVAMNLLYSRYLKGEPFVDVLVIALGFVLRVVAGAFAIGVAASHWLILTTFFLALFLGFGKRRAETIGVADERARRSVLRLYSTSLLNCLIVVSAALTITWYTLYTVASRAGASIGADGFVWTVPLVVFGVFRYLGVVFDRNDGEDPADLILRDRLLLLAVVLWVALVVVLVQHSAGGLPQ